MAAAIRPSRLLQPAGLLVALAALGACGEGGGPRPEQGAGDAARATQPGADTATGSPAAVADGLAVLDPWVRAAIVPDIGAGEAGPPINSAAYLAVRNAGDAGDALVAASSPAASAVEIHEVSLDDGVMRMRQVDSVAVPAGGTAVLEPGGYHIMLIGLSDPLVAGDTVALTLRFRSGREIDLRAPVR